MADSVGDIPLRAFLTARVPLRSGIGVAHPSRIFVNGFFAAYWRSPNKLPGRCPSLWVEHPHEFWIVSKSFLTTFAHFWRVGTKILPTDGLTDTPSYRDAWTHLKNGCRWFSEALINNN